MGTPNVIHADYTTQAHRLNSSDKKHALGQSMVYPDGRKWRYGLNGTPALIVGDVIQGKAVVAADAAGVVIDVAASVGATSLSITPTTTTAANYYDEGWLHIQKGTGLEDGYMHKTLKSGSHLIFSAASGHIVYLDLDDPVRVALAVNAECGLAPNAYNGMVVAVQTTLTNRIVGVAQTPLVAAYYGFVQTRGMSAVNSAASEVLGNIVIAILAAAGRVGVPDTAGLDQEVGIVIGVPDTAGEYGSIFLTLE